jgi:hypothetical protein
MVTKQEEEEIEEEEEEEEEKEEKGDKTFKYIIIFGIGILVGYVIHKFLQERHRKEQFIVVPSGYVYDGHQVTPKFETTTATHTPKLDPFTNILNKNIPGNNHVQVNGMTLEKDTNRLVVGPPCEYEHMIIKRDIETGEIVDIVMTGEKYVK